MGVASLISRCNLPRKALNTLHEINLTSNCDFEYKPFLESLSRFCNSGKWQDFYNYLWFKMITKKSDLHVSLPRAQGRIKLHNDDVCLQGEFQWVSLQLTAIWPLTTDKYTSFHPIFAKKHLVHCQVKQPENLEVNLHSSWLWKSKGLTYIRQHRINSLACVLIKNDRSLIKAIHHSSIT